MPDREKIISAIEKAKKQSEENAQDAIIVPFKEVDMIISLLKEQKAVEPDTNSAGTCTCGTCGETVGYYPAGCNIPRKLCKFCPECGRAVKWE
jgi:hypothetical protein